MSCRPRWRPRRCGQARLSSSAPHARGLKPPSASGEPAVFEAGRRRRRPHLHAVVIEGGKIARSALAAISMRSAMDSCPKIAPWSRHSSAKRKRSRPADFHLSLLLITYSVFRLAARRTGSATETPLSESAAVSEKRVGLVPLSIGPLIAGVCQYCLHQSRPKPRGNSTACNCSTRSRSSRMVSSRSATALSANPAGKLSRHS